MFCKNLAGNAEYEKGNCRLELHSLKHFYPIELSITHSHVPQLSDVELATLNEFRVDEDLDFSNLTSLPCDDVAPLDDPGLDFDAIPDAFQDQNLEEPVLHDILPLVSDPFLEDPLPDNALSSEDIVSSDHVPESEEPLFSSNNAAPNELGVSSAAAALPSNEGVSLLYPNQDFSAALSSNEGESSTDPYLNCSVDLPCNLYSSRANSLFFVLSFS